MIFEDNKIFNYPIVYKGIDFCKTFGYIYGRKLIIKTIIKELAKDD